MSVEENIRVVRATIEAINARDWDGFDSVHAESVVVSTPQTPEPTKGRAAHRESVQVFTTAFPDLRIEEERIFGQGDWLCSERIATGTHKGPLRGAGGQTVPATGKPVRVGLVEVSKVEGGEITEERLYFDLLGMMAQLGLAPEGGP